MNANEHLATPWWETKVIVCDKCFQATCWQGIFMCHQAYEAGTVEKTIYELMKLGPLEHPENWASTEAAIDALPEQAHATT